MNNKTAFTDGMRDGVPVGLGYFAVSFSLGITAGNAGLTPFQGFLASLLPENMPVLQSLHRVHPM